jgi:hypothetical protein
VVISPSGDPDQQDASRFARDLIAQELGIVLLVARGVKVITAAGDDLTDTIGSAGEFARSTPRHSQSVGA